MVEKERLQTASTDGKRPQGEGRPRGSIRAILGIAPVVALCLVSATVCVLGIPAQVPDRDIVFQPISDDVEASSFDFLSLLVGFVNADGSGRMTIPLAGVQQGVMGLYQSYFGVGGMVLYPSWSADGSVLSFRATGRPGVREGSLAYPSFYRAGQRVRACPASIPWGSGPIGLSEDAGIAVLEVHPDTALSIAPAPQGGVQAEVVTLGSPRVAVVELDDCTIRDLFEGAPLGGADISADGKTVVFAGEEGLVVLDTQSGESRTFGPAGRGARWSPSGDRISMTRCDGIHVLASDGSEDSRVLELPLCYIDRYTFQGREVAEERMVPWYPVASWSPDGNWLVYHRCNLPNDPQCGWSSIENYSIYKLNLATGEEVKITDRGINPYWR